MDIIIQVIKNELIKNEYHEDIKDTLGFSEEIIMLIYKKIATFQTVNEAELLLIFLNELHTTIALYVFRPDKIGFNLLSDFLYNFLTDFDRIDDRLQKEYIFNKIKTGYPIPTPIT